MGFVVGVYFDVLVGDLFFLEDGPGALDEGAAFFGGDVRVLLFLFPDERAGSERVYVLTTSLSRA